MSTRISGRTKTIALIGTPVEHSMSPAMHNTAFDHLGIDAIYTAYNVSEAGLAAAVKGMAEMGFAGYNVTVPHKAKIMSFLDDVSDAAKFIGSVNTVVIENGKSIGHNTDGLSFTETLKQSDISPAGLNLVVADINAEGPAYITQSAIEGARRITVLTKASSVPLAKNGYGRIAEATNCCIEVYDIDDYGAYASRLNEAKVFCNATRIGASPKEHLTPLPAHLLHADLTIIDTIYSPRVTRLMRDAQISGCKTIGGLTLLLNQAALAEKLWLGCDMPQNLIRETFF